MDFGSSGREGFNEEEHIDMDLGICMSKGKLPFPYSSSSSSSSSSSRHKSEQLASPRNSEWEEQHQMPSNWLGNRYEPEEDNTEVTATAATITTTTTVSEPDSKLVDLDSTCCLSPDIQKEHMFDKVVTPSDVGKLNRLVIPKQHAEKYFPLDSSANEKGLLLNFEDRNGKPWRFRYSYWNSSQSYVMTKGWSRFVKDKKLDAGDIVSFQRGAGEMYKDRLFIDWRRRPDAPDMVSFHPRQHHFSLNHSIPWSPMLMRPPPPMNYPLSRSSYYDGYPTGTKTMGGSLFYLRSPVPQMGMGMMHRQLQGGGVEPIVFDSVPVVQGNTATTKRLRLFGVNMECPVSESDECEMLPTTTLPHAATMTSQNSKLSSSFHHHLQLRLHHGTPLPPDVNKGKASLSFNFDM